MIGLLLWLLGPAAFAGNEVGNGGDPLHILVTEARDALIGRAEPAVAEDLRASRILWLAERPADFAKTECICTDPHPGSVLMMEENACAPVLTDRAATEKLLLAAAAKHLGLAEAPAVASVDPEHPVVMLPPGASVQITAISAATGAARPVPRPETAEVALLERGLIPVSGPSRIGQGIVAGPHLGVHHIVATTYFQTPLTADIDAFTVCTHQDSDQGKCRGGADYAGTVPQLVMVRSTGLKYSYLFDTRHGVTPRLSGAGSHNVTSVQYENSQRAYDQQGSQTRAEQFDVVEAEVGAGIELGEHVALMIDGGFTHVLTPTRSLQVHASKYFNAGTLSVGLGCSL